MPWMSCVKLSINYDEVRFSLHVVFKRCNTLQKLLLPADKFCPIPNNTQNVFQHTSDFKSKENHKRNFLPLKGWRQKQIRKSDFCVVKQQKCIVKKAKCLRNNVPTWWKQQMSDSTLQTHSWLQPHGNQTKKQFAKHVFVQKNASRQSNKAKARVEILFALRWNFDCITLLTQGFLFVYWAYT